LATRLLKVPYSLKVDVHVFSDYKAGLGSILILWKYQSLSPQRSANSLYSETEPETSVTLWCHNKAVNALSYLLDMDDIQNVIYWSSPNFVTYNIIWGMILWKILLMAGNMAIFDSTEYQPKPFTYYCGLCKVVNCISESQPADEDSHSVSE